MVKSENWEVVVIGGGAAGLWCAAVSAKRGRKTLVLEHNAEVGKKILISGGGRCNFTNYHARPEHYLSSNPHFCKSALARFTPQDFIELVQKHKIPFHEKKLGQLFCDRSAREIVEMLVRECAWSGVEIRTGISVTGVEKSDYFRISTSDGEIQAESVVIASGGLSIPTLGASDFAFRIAKRFKIKVVPTFPALVPLTFSPDYAQTFSTLSGISLDAKVRCGKAEFRENILLTHRGVSGPAMLQISSFWQKGELIGINLVPDTDIRALFEQKRIQKAEVKTVLAEILPRRFAETWCAKFGISGALNRYSPKEREAIAGTLEHWQIVPSGTEGYAKAEVTRGGVDTGELSSKTMSANNVPGLFFVGEATDVTGWLGGYNFQWAWSSGNAAGLAV